MLMQRLVTAAAAGAILVATAVPAAAQLNSNESSVSLTAILPESLTVSVLPGAVDFTLTSGSADNPGNLPVSVTTTWTLALARTHVKLYGYFTSAAAALAHTHPLNTRDIPSSRVEVSVNGAAKAAFDQTVAFGGANAGRELAAQSISALNVVGQRTDTISLNVNLANYDLPADAYTGTLRLRAQATP